MGLSHDTTLNFTSNIKKKRMADRKEKYYFHSNLLAMSILPLSELQAFIAYNSRILCGLRKCFLHQGNIFLLALKTIQSQSMLW